jgi:hypothetical protein
MNKINYEYYDWLVEQIHIPNGKSYSGLFEVMHNTEFHWTIPNDDNRVQDGKDLRYYFIDGRKGRIDLDGATLLEILVSLSQKVAFTAGGVPKRWAWKLLKNLRLTEKSDPLTEHDLERINDVLDALVWRTYQPNGRGGFFPLNHPEQDQTKVEIWYQMNAYVIERTP